jgi:hypothetical protein
MKLYSDRPGGPSHPAADSCLGNDREFRSPVPDLEGVCSVSHRQKMVLYGKQWTEGHAVAYFAEALYYKTESYGFDSRLGLWISQLT